MFYNAKNHTATIDDDTTDFISFGKGKKNLVIIPGVGDCKRFGNSICSHVQAFCKIFYRLCYEPKK